MTLRVAIVGTGAIGSRHAQIYSEDPRCEVAAVCDVMPEKAEEAARRFSCRAFTSVEEMAQSGGIDIASVCTAGVENGGDHYQPTMELLNAGIPVLGEKPISNKIPELERWWRWPGRRVCGTGSTSTTGSPRPRYGRGSGLTRAGWET